MHMMQRGPLGINFEYMKTMMSVEKLGYDLEYVKRVRLNSITSLLITEEIVSCVGNLYRVIAKLLDRSIGTQFLFFF